MLLFKYYVINFRIPEAVPVDLTEYAVQMTDDTMTGAKSPRRVLRDENESPWVSADDLYSRLEFYHIQA